MRMMIAAALLLAGVSAAAATSFTSQPFPIDPATDGQQVFTSVFDAGDGRFGVVLSEDTDGDDQKLADQVSLLGFDAAGKAVGKKAVVRPAGGSTSGVLPAGGLPLTDGKVLATSLLSDFTGTAPDAGLTGQRMANGKRSGDAFALDTVTSGQFFFGYLEQLSGGRGLAYWSSAAGFGAAQTAAARFVSPAGVPGPADLDLSRPDTQLAGVQPFGDGFIVQHVRNDFAQGRATVFARVHDVAGAPTGAEMKIADDVPFRNAIFTSSLGLADGSILVMRSVKKDGTIRLLARRYDAAFAPLGKEKTLRAGLADQLFVAQPLPGGDLLIGVKVPDGDAQALEFSRFTPALKQNGAAARVTGVKKPDLVQLRALETGDAVALYTSAKKKMRGRLIKP